MAATSLPAVLASRVAAATFSGLAGRATVPSTSRREQRCFPGTVRNPRSAGPHGGIPALQTFSVVFSPVSSWTAPGTQVRVRSASSTRRRATKRTANRKQGQKPSQKSKPTSVERVDSQLNSMLKSAAANPSLLNQKTRASMGLRSLKYCPRIPTDSFKELQTIGEQVYQTLKSPFPSADRSDCDDPALVVGPKYLEDLRASFQVPRISNEKLMSTADGTLEEIAWSGENTSVAGPSSSSLDGGVQLDVTELATTTELQELPLENALDISSPLSLSQFNATMQANLLAKRVDAVKEVFGLVKEVGLTPQHKTYSLLLQAHAYAGDIASALSTFTTIKEVGFIPNVEDYISIMKAYTKNFKVERAYEVYGQMRSAAIKPTHDVFATLIRACNTTREAKRAWATYDRMRYEGWGANSELYSLMMECCAQTKDVERALTLLDEMIDHSMQPTGASFNAAVKACASRKDYSAEGFDLVAQMRNQGFYPDVNTTTSLICISANMNDLHRARGLFFEGLINRGYVDSLLRVNTDAATAMLAAYGEVTLRHDGLAVKEVARRRELAAAFAHKQKLEVDRMAYCLEYASKRPSLQVRREIQLREEEEEIDKEIRRLEELGEQYRREQEQRGDLRLSVVDADGGSPVSAGMAALAPEMEVKLLESPDTPAHHAPSREAKSEYALMEVQHELPNAVRPFEFMREEAPKTNEECISEATKILTLVTGVHPAPSNAQLATLAPPLARSAAAEVAIFRVEPNIAMLNTYLSTLLRRSPPRADAHLPTAALEVFAGFKERYGLEPNGHTYALVIKQLSGDVRNDSNLCRDFPGREETLHIDKARLEETLRIFQKWKLWHAANVEHESLPAISSEGAVSTIPIDGVEVAFLKAEKGVTDLVFFQVHRDVCNALARCDRIKESLELATELRDRHKYTLNIRDFRDVYRACKRNEYGPSMLRLLDLCPPSAHSPLERAKTVLGTRLHGSPNDLQYFLNRSKRNRTRKRIVLQEEENSWTQERLEFIRRNM